MKTSIAFLGVVASLVLAGRQAQAVTVLDDKEHDRSLSVGILLQPQLTFTQDGAPPPAPTGHNLSTDFFLRRVRMYTAGQITKGLTFFLQIDQPNLGQNGNFVPSGTTSAFFRDAVVSYEFAREFSIDGGLILFPFTHNSLEGAGSLHTVDYRPAPALNYPGNEGRIFSDVGVQLRGLLFDDRLHYRVGAFEGARAGSSTPPNPLINESGIPRFTGMLRFNILGVEDKFYFQGVYFAEKPLVSIGVGGDFQPHAETAPTGISDYAAANADVFVEYPLTGDDEIIANAAVADWRVGKNSPGTGVSVFGEAGYRHAWIEPLIAMDWFKADDNLRDYVDIRPGLNFWLRKHNGNIKAEAVWSSNWTPAEQHVRSFQVVVQGQVFF
ncbi:MAG: hypothetical protein JOZ69_02395 [Myxococcales bacterium]|nr:hypothetical protein [Myxococcales bacterium]